jgi:DNA-binding MarR family transcriptional regulator
MIPKKFEGGKMASIIEKKREETEELIKAERSRKQKREEEKENFNLSVSEFLALLRIKEKEGEQLPAKELRHCIPGENPYKPWISLRQVRNITSSLERKGWIKKQRHKNARGGDAANSYKLISPLTPYRVTHLTINRPNRLFSILGLRGEIISYLSHLAEKVRQRTQMPWERLLRLMFWILKNLGIEAWYLAEQCELLLRQGIRTKDASGRRIRSRGDYFIACLKNELT